MRRWLRQSLLPARALAIKRDGTKRQAPGMEDDHDSGPRMADDKAVARLEPLGVCRLQPGPVWARTIDYEGSWPGQPLELWQGWGNGLGGWLGEARQRRDCDLAMGLQPLREVGGGPSGKPGGFGEGRLRGHDHQKQQITGAAPLKTATDPDTPRAPSLRGARPHGASSLEPLDRERVA
jgi:hypothetical protein